MFRSIYVRNEEGESKNKYSGQNHSNEVHTVPDTL